MSQLIHYCWFGGNVMPVRLESYIESWRRFLPGFEIKRWDESNFDVHCCQYVSEAYDAGMWAFVSDYCRFWALEKYGGLYFDTDVEVIRPLGDLLELEAFAGFENDVAVAPGLVLYAREPHQQIMQKTLEWYECHPFLDEEGRRIRINVCGVFTSVLGEFGFVPNGQLQTCGGLTVFPKDYFCPFDDATGLLHKTENTCTIHWYDKSWMSKGRVLRNRCTRPLHRLLGTDFKKRVLQFFRKKS